MFHTGCLAGTLSALNPASAVFPQQSFTSCIIGLTQAEGRLKITDKLISFFPGYDLHETPLFWRNRLKKIILKKQNQNHGKSSGRIKSLISVQIKRPLTRQLTVTTRIKDQSSIPKLQNFRQISNCVESRDASLFTFFIFQEHLSLGWS